ncbi:MAG: right-handed parallel beta-helix repeat-containing protein [Acidobacteria bacterium]|nr:right-handed parallel beta-helix repeat-containing protein [Acidobacteriota bacterium]
MGACLAWGAEVHVAPGANLQTIVNRSPAESEFVLAPGVHRAEQIRLRNGDTLRGEIGAALIGSFFLSNVSDVEIRELRLSSPLRDCIQVSGSSGVRIRASEIGPCVGAGVVIHGSRMLVLTDNYIHPEHPVSHCCDEGDGVYAVDSTQLRIAGNVIAYGETNIEMHGVADADVVGNFLLNPMGPYPRGQHVQAYFGSHDIHIEGNYLLSSKSPEYAFPEHQEDAINAGRSTSITVTGNFITGGSSPSGCGVIADEGAHSMMIVDNTLWNTGQCGIGIASGRDHQIVGNKVRNAFLNHPGAGNTAIYVWRQYPGDCGPVRLSGNTAFARKPTGEFSSLWIGQPSCEPVTVTQNVFGERALDALPNEVLEALRPAIPPGPQHCVAASPFSTNPERRCMDADTEGQGPSAPVRSRAAVSQSP